MLRLRDFEKLAKKKLRDDDWNFISGGAEDEVTLRENREAIKRYKLLPRMLRDTSQIDISTTVQGHLISSPVCIAPTATHQRAHPEGECASAASVSEMGTFFTLSSYGSRSIEEVANSCGTSGLLFYQLYLLKDRALVKELVERAKQAGYKGIIVTVDSPTTSILIHNHWQATRKGFAGQTNMTYPNLLRPHQQNLSESEKFDIGESLLDDSITWSDITWLKSITDLPIIVKGILTGEDAHMAVEYQVNGILVSNHGGRQLDTVPATIDVLEEIVDAVGGDRKSVV